MPFLPQFQDMRTADDQCAECNPGYTLTEDLTCAAFTCRTGPGSACKACRLKVNATANDQCSEAGSAGFGDIFWPVPWGFAEVTYH